MPQHRRVPSSRSATRRFAGVLSAVILAALPASTTAAAPAEVLAVADGLWVEAPAPGFGIALTALTVDGGGFQLVAETDRDGVTRVIGPGTLQGPGSLLDRVAARLGVAATSSACKDGMHRETGFRWTRPWAWRFRANSTPSGLGRAKATSDLRAAVRSITHARNDCGRPDRVSARATYLGRTTRKPGVRVNGRRVVCSQDGMNVVGFGSLPPQVAGMTCTTFAKLGGRWKPAVESDVLLNKRHHGWARRASSCSTARNQVILRSVATHEFGHVFGLDHVPEAGHGTLTMSESIGVCDDSAYTLGKGDILGLERLY